MKIIPSKKQLFTLLQLLFWFISFIFWNGILNPGVESANVIQSQEVSFDIVLLVNFLFLIYCFLPFIWLIRGVKPWIKISFTFLFLLPLGFVIFRSMTPDINREYGEVVMAAYFVKNFLYVLLFHSTIVAAVYLNFSVLIVRYLNHSRFGAYLAYAVGLIVVTAVLNYALFDWFIDPLFPSLYYISYFRIWELMLIVASYLVFTTVLFLIWQYARLLIAKRDAARDELSALKAQINPHFLFNNLNTIYSMASQKDERTPEVILKLSDFLRYVLYDTSNETIPLEKEVDIIRIYVGLQKERVNPEITQIQFTTEGNFEAINISPLLLLPLAENCFKHGIGKNPGIIQIFIAFDGKQLIFKTKNNIALREKTNIQEIGGIGIINVKKRLNLLYPDRHSLEYHAEEGIFFLELRIEPGK